MKIPTQGNITLGYLSAKLEDSYEQDLSQKERDKVQKYVFNTIQEVLKAEPNCLNEKVFYSSDIKSLVPQGVARFGSYLLYSLIKYKFNAEYFKEIMDSNPQININIKEDNERTLIHLAISLKNQPVFDYLVNRKDINLNIVDKFGDSLLHILNNQRLPILSSNLEIMRKIIIHPNSNCVIKNKEGKTAYDSYLPEYQKYFDEYMIEKEKLLFEQEIKSSNKKTKIKV